MHIREIIEDMVEKELKGLCFACTHSDSCPTHGKRKIVIQCEVVDVVESHEAAPTIYGLCKTCDHAHECMLPGRKAGVWHCNEYE